MGRKQTDLERAEQDKAKTEAIRAELDGRKQDRKAFTKPFVAHGGKPPSPPPASV